MAPLQYNIQWSLSRCDQTEVYLQGFPKKDVLFLAGYSFSDEIEAIGVKWFENIDIFKAFRKWAYLLEHPLTWQ